MKKALSAPNLIIFGVLMFAFVVLQLGLFPGNYPMKLTILYLLALCALFGLGMSFRQHLAGKLLIAAVLVVLPFVSATAGQAWVRILDFAILYAFLALGLNIVVGLAGLLDLGYVAFYAVGAYTWALLASPHFGLHLPFWVILPTGALVACCFGVLLGSPTLKLRGDYLAIVTLGFGEIVRIFMNNLNAPINITNGPQGITLIDPVAIGGFKFSGATQIFGYTLSGPQKYYFLLLVLAILVVIINQRLQNSRIGRAWQAIREDEVAAKAVGINTRNLKLLAFAMGASFGGMAGGVFAAMQGFVSPESFSLNESIMILAMVVLGGMGHIPGVILGAVLLSILPEVLRYGVGPLQTQLFGKMLVDPESLRLLVFGLALVLVMRFKPAGLWPSPERQRELVEGRTEVKP
ncbi:MAG: transporter ATP-binding protein [Proteobacteria bacterium]|nr:transporter ATP-binding protein [Pseudomonadota bacterium]